MINHRIAGQRRIGAAVHKTEHIIVSDILAKPDATLVVELDARRESGAPGFDIFILDEMAVASPMLGGKLLQAALARFITNGAVERVVDEGETRSHHYANP